MQEDYGDTREGFLVNRERNRADELEREVRRLRSGTMINDVRAFHHAMGVPVLDKPTVPSEERIKLRMLLIAEEFTELKEAMGFREVGGDKWLSECDLPETADAIADLIYVLIGTAHEFGIPLQAVWDEVQRSNMEKLGPDGKPIVREDGKVIKPPGWQPPQIERVLREAGWEK